MATRPKIIDLFSGVGGLSLGAARAGFHVAIAADRDPHASAMHQRNFPATAHFSSDLATATGDSILDHAGIKRDEIAGVIGGPPCQGFSTIGRRNKLDKRNHLFGHFFRLVSEIRPKFFVAENVPGILAPQNEPLLISAIERVESNYTVLAPISLTASDFGAPTTRTRVFFIGIRKDLAATLTPKSFSKKKTGDPITVKKALKGLPSRIDSRWQREELSWRKVARLQRTGFSERAQGRIPVGIGDKPTLLRYKIKNEVSGFFGTKHSPVIRKRYAAVGQGKTDHITRSRRLESDGFCPTLRAGTGSDRGSFQAVRPLHPIADRVITPREAARLQGFPDWFLFSPTKWHSFRQIGNSVSPILSEHVFRQIISEI